jgi:5'/3'-nucleotidase SurE
MRIASLSVTALLACLGVIAPAHMPASAEPVPPAALCGEGPLDILLTNDDGFQAAGIRALHAALKEAGHRVFLVAPAANASGSSASFTWGRVHVVRDLSDPSVFGVGGSPATAVVLGATALYPPGRRPDLVISGINDGTNTGSLLALSGTIGAALAGTMLLDPPVPGFAVNAERPEAPGKAEALPGDHLQQVARHFARMVGTTRGWFCDRGQVTRATTVLNTNYPARPLSATSGTRVAGQGRATDLRLAFEASGDDTYESRRGIQPDAPDEADSDNALLARGYVTVTPIRAELGGRDGPLGDLQHRLGR